MIPRLSYRSILRIACQFGHTLGYATLIVGLFCSAGIAESGPSEVPTALSDYIYPVQLNYGSLNALSGINPADAQVAIEMNFDRLSKSINSDFKVSLKFLEDAQTAAALIRQRKLHALSITGIDYLILSRLVDVRPFFVASKLSDTPLEPYVLLTRKGVFMNDLLSMKTRRLLVDSNNPWDIGRIWLETILNEKGLPPSKRLFTSIQVTKKPIRTILPVFFGHAEACLVPKSAFDTMVDLNPQIGQKLHVLLRSPGFVKNLICIADFLDPKLVKEMKVALRDMHTTDEGRQLLVIFQLRRNFPYKPEYLLETEGVFRRYRKMNPGFANQNP